MVIDYSRDERALTIYSELNQNCEDFGLGSEKNLDDILKKSLLNFPKWKKHDYFLFDVYKIDDHSPSDCHSKNSRKTLLFWKNPWKGDTNCPFFDSI